MKYHFISLHLFIVLLFQIEFSVKAQQKDFEILNGDIFFQNLDCGPFCDAVEKVTTGYKSAKFSHIAIAFNNDKGQKFVIEAISKGVSITPLQEFLSKSTDKQNNPKVVVGRLKPKYRKLIPKAIVEALKLVGQPYDEEFSINNKKYYCSELIYEIFKTANNGKPIFDLKPMTFKDPETSKTFQIWIDYYNNLHQPIPEGKPGINPGSISLSKNIQIIYFYGNTDG